MGYCKPGDPCYSDIFKNITQKLSDLGVNLPESVMSPSDPIAADFINCFNISTDSLCTVISACTSGITSGGSSKYVESGNADAASQTLTFTYSDASTFNVANSVALFSDNDINVTGGTYNPYNGCVTFITNSGTSFDLCGFLTGYSTTLTACTITTDIIHPCTTGLTITSNLVVDGKAFFSGNTHVDDNLFVSGTTNLRNNLIVSGETSANGIKTLGHIIIENDKGLLFRGTPGSGSVGGITYEDSSGVNRGVLDFTSGDVVVLQNRAANGNVEIRANNTAGSLGETTVAEFKYDLLTLNTQVELPTQSGLVVTGNTRIGSSLFVSGTTHLRNDVTITNGSLTLTDGKYIYPDNGTTNTFIRGVNDDLYIAADDDLILDPDDDLIIAVGSTPYASFDGGKKALSVGPGTPVIPTGTISMQGANPTNVFLINSPNQDKVHTTIVDIDFRDTASELPADSSWKISGEPDVNKTWFTACPYNINIETSLPSDLALGVYAAPNDNPTEVLTITGKYRYVGIRNSNPLVAFSVNGSISGNTDLTIGGNLRLDGGYIEGNMFFSGNTYIDDNLFVSGTTNLRNDVFITDGDLQVSGATRLDSLRVNQYIEFDYSDGSTFIGYTAGQYHDSNSDYNTAVGHQAMALGTMNGADKNTGIGHAALSFLTSGDDNIGIGSQAAGSANTASSNIAIGTQAMFQNNVNNYNIGIGQSCMYFSNYPIGNTHNVGVGYSTQYYSVYGRHNTSVGNYTLGNGSAVGNLGGTGNTAMGFRCLSATTTAAYNTAVGWEAGARLTSGRANILIGQNSQVLDGAGDYQLNIGDTIFGQLNPSSGETTGKIVVSGNTMINNNLFISNNLAVSGTTTLTAGGTQTFNPRPNLYWFANCDAQTFSPATDGSFPSTNTTDVSWSVTHNSHASVYTWSAEELTITRAGLYKISYNVTLEGGADGTASNRVGGGIALLVNGAVVDGTEAYVYCRITNIERNTGAVSVIYNVTADDVFKIVFIRTGAQTSSSKLGTIIAGTAWTVEAVS